MKTLDLSKYKTPAGAAKALYNYLRPICESWGQNPDIELNLLTPAMSESLGYGKEWRVMWEAGPYEWGVYLSLGGNWSEGNYSSTGSIIGWENDNWYMEPYWSFDVGFVKS